ncbi:MAG TPA: lysine biosynthesis protein LysX [Phycisphaerales bacterium]|nr:lysine biosynthesis protein LysX [Phycisphaerales bacterium]
MRIALLHSRIRVEERLLIEELERRGIDHEVIDVRAVTFDIHDPSPWRRFDAVFERCISQTQAVTAVRLLESFGVPCVNPSAVIDVCGDKLTTSLRLASAGVPTPRVRVALDEASALEAVESMGYPCVMKPATGSWGRLLARINDRDAAEALIEHKATLGSVQHGVFYVQEYIDKPGRDIRVFVIGGESIAAIARSSEHWVTNTARGGRAEAFPIAREVGDLCAAASNAVGGGILAVDLLETRDGRVLVNEINHTMEFRNSIEPTGVDIPGRMIDFVASIAERHHRSRSEVEPKPAAQPTGGARR